jgi:hypothetical protein
MSLSAVRVAAARAASRLASARALAAPRGSGFSTLASFPFDVTADEADLDRAVRGLNVDLNHSLAGDGLSTRGEAYRNASVRDLIEFSERAAVRVTKERAVDVVGGPFAARAKFAAYATDALPGLKTMDVEDYEKRLASVRAAAPRWGPSPPPLRAHSRHAPTSPHPPHPTLSTFQIRDECLSYAPRLFVEDAAVGSTASAEVRVRVVSDSPVASLYFRSLLHKIPLYSPQAFPRTITVYVASLAGPDIGAARGMASPYTVVDVDPATARGTVLIAGAVPLSAMRDALASAASTLQIAGGYRHRLGGSHVPAIAEAQSEGYAAWCVSRA